SPESKSSIQFFYRPTPGTGEFSSPCYPQHYPKSLACKWTMQAPTGFIIQLSFLDFDLEEALGCIYDRVLVNTGSAEVRLCGLTAHGLTLNSTGSLMELSFNSDFSVQKKGFRVSYHHVAVALRNQKVQLSGGKSSKVARSVSIPTMSHMTTCFEVAGTAKTNVTKTTKPGFFYHGRSMELLVDGEACDIQALFSSSDLGSSMQPVCLTWTSTSGLIAVSFKGSYRTATCPDTVGAAVPAGGELKVGGKTEPAGFNVSVCKDSISGEIYNFRLWDYAMTAQQLAALTCDAVGSVVDWDTSHWDIARSQAVTDATLSCSEYHAPLAAMSTAVRGIGPTWLYNRIGCNILICAVFPLNSFLLSSSPLSSFTIFFYSPPPLFSLLCSLLSPPLLLPSLSLPSPLLPPPPPSYTLQALLVYSHSTNDSLGEALVSSRLSSSGGSMGRGLQLQTDSIQVKAIEHCPEESPLHYRWPKTRPTTTQHLPCFPNKEVKTSRTCMISSQNLSSYWSPPDLSNCTDIDNIELSAENAAEVAVQLADITNNALSDEEVSKVVTKVKELVNLVKVNFTLASTVVTIISNIMTGSESMPAAASEKVLRTVDDLVQKIEFEGPSVMISSRHLAVAVSALNASSYNGTSFSASIPPNNTDPQTDSGHPLAQVTLPASLLTSDSLSEAERDTVDRINFMFFSKNNFFQGEQDGLSLNSYVVASSVGNQSISNLPEPIEIHITHLFYQPSPNPVCMFWDFTMKGTYGDGGWNREGCRVSPLSNHNKTVCLCDHLTHFGILMDISGAAPQIDQRNTKILTFITYIGCGVSAIFSAATLLTYIAFEKLRRDYPSKILMNLSTSLLFLNMVFLLDGWLASMDADWLCVSVAVFLHYFLLTTFTWMGLESIHMYIALVKVFNTYIRRYILKFCLVGWGLPAVLVSVVVAVDRKSYGRQEYGRGSPGEETQGSSEFCWIQSPVVFYITCVGYFCLVFLMNVAMFVVVMQQICGRNGKRSNRTLREEVLRNLRSVISLTFLLGMTWGFALFAWGPVNVAFMYLFAIFNSLQGLFIFVFHCALKENVQKQWRRYLCCGKLRLADNSDWSKTPTNNTKKVSSENLGKSLSSSSFSSTTATWTSKAKPIVWSTIQLNCASHFEKWLKVAGFPTLLTWVANNCLGKQVMIRVM
uniref:Adhesion G protein-coupled receptor G6 n=1 Tax=Gadus morhua TaxID=8049 RepID=A0A8C5F488_GADMO